MKLSRRVLANSFLIGLGIVLALAVLTYRSLNQLRSTSQWEAHTQEVLRRLNGLDANLIGAQSEALGFAITGDEANFQRYVTRRAAVNDRFDLVRQLTTDNPNQQQRLNGLAPLLAIRISLMDRIIELRRAGEPNAERSLIAKDAAADLIPQMLQEMSDEETRLLVERNAQSESSARRTMTLLVIGTMLSGAFLITVVYGFNRSLIQRSQNERMRHRFLQVSLDMLGIANMDGYFSEVNPAWEKVLGFTSTELTSRPYLEFVHPEDRERTMEQSADLVEGAHIISFENRYVCKDGSYKWLLWNAVPDVESKVIYAVARDITDRKSDEHELRRQALTDDLTGLLNRRGFLALAEQQLNLAIRTNTELLLIYVDVDGLKQINDRLGHDQGSYAIISAAQILRETFRLTDISARLGGDEFVVLAIEAGENEADLIRARLDQNISRFNQTGSCDFELSLSVGIARFRPLESVAIEELMQQADAAMYENKQARRTKVLT